MSVVQLLPETRIHVTLTRDGSGTAQQAALRCVFLAACEF